MKPTKDKLIKIRINDNSFKNMQMVKKEKSINWSELIRKFVEQQLEELKSK